MISVPGAPNTSSCRLLIFGIENPREEKAMSVDISEGQAVAWAESLDLDEHCPWEFDPRTICALHTLLKHRVHPARSWNEVALHGISLRGRRRG